MILLVEDDDDIRDALAEMLRDEGFEVRTAPNGREALDKLDGCDLIVLDLMMPVMDGWEFRRLQLADPVKRTIPVIVLTGVSDTADALRRLQAAAALQKPFEPDELLALVKRLRA
jgi:DNA-binding response OmpR family regulator